MLLDRTERLKRQVSKLEKQIRKNHPVDFVAIRLINDRNKENKTIILELKIAV